jgi:hypothetical protein
MGKDPKINQRNNIESVREGGRGRGLYMEDMVIESIIEKWKNSIYKI